MADLPASVASVGRLRGLVRTHQGKVRDTYVLPDHPGFLLVVASDRISIFDFVLLAFVSKKGAVLTALVVFWLTQVLVGVEHHLVAHGAGIDAYLPESLRGNVRLQARAIIVRELEMIPVEAVMRGHLTGSALAAYRQNGSAWGHPLPSGLADGSELPHPIFTPTTKALVGHDLPLDHIRVNADEPALGPFAEEVFEMGSRFARSRGVILADSKFEFGRDLRSEHPRRLVLGDEVFTPDCSRLWDEAEWRDALAHGRAPKAFDKQYVREEGKRLGIHTRDPAVPADVAWVHAQTIRPEVISETTRIYLEIFQRLTGMSLETFQEQVMHIRPVV